MKNYLLAVLLISVFSADAQPQTYPSSFTVAQDGTGNFRTIQEAINAVRDLSQQRVVIHIRNGVYHEKLVVPSWKTMITLEGESEAVALHVEGDRCAIRNCRLLGNQDTLYAGTEGSRQYYKDCYIEGTTDFIFGEATVVFDSCVIRSLINSYVTAAATTPRQEYGFVFLDCSLIADTAAKKVFLGRPWRPYAKVVYIRTEMGAQIVPVGWDNWRNPENEKTAYYAEYGSKGPGAVVSGRAGWSRQLTAREAKKYTAADVLGDWVKGYL